MNKNKKAPQKRMSLSYRSNRSTVSPTSMKWLGYLSLVGFCLALYGMLYPEQFTDFPHNLKIGFLSQSLASEGASSSAVSPVKEEKKSTDVVPQNTTPGESTEAVVSEKPSHVEQLLEKEKELIEREKRIVELEEKLQQQKLELDEKIKVLDQTRRDIASRLETRVAQDQENIDKLVGVYTNMKPQSAAQVISKLDEELAISVLRKMKKQDAGAIMNYMDPQKTKVLSEKYSGY